MATAEQTLKYRTAPNKRGIEPDPHLRKTNQKSSREAP